MEWESQTREKVKEKNRVKLASYPLSTVPPQSSHRQLKHQPAGSPGCHCPLDHHSTLQSVCLRGCERSMCVRSGCPSRPVQPDCCGSRELARGCVYDGRKCVM